MKADVIDTEPARSGLDQQLDHAIQEIIRAVRSIAFGSVEIVIHNSQIVQLEYKEKIRLDRT